MNSLSLVSIKIDDLVINFRRGVNYIVGNSDSGKTTIYRFIKYALGLKKEHRSFSGKNVELVVQVGGSPYTFSRGCESIYLYVCFDEVERKFRPNSTDLNDFYKSLLDPFYLFGDENESVYDLLEFVFLPEDRVINFRKRTEAIRSVMGAGLSLIDSVSKDIGILKSEVSKNKDYQHVINSFSKFLMEKDSSGLGVDCSFLDEKKEEFFLKYQETEDLYYNASEKLESLKIETNKKVTEKLSQIERLISHNAELIGLERLSVEDIQSVLSGRGSRLSGSQDQLVRLLSILAIAQLTDRLNLNFPSLIVNDGYLSFEASSSSYWKTRELIQEALQSNDELQYIEFTHRQDVPSEEIVCNLNDHWGLKIYGG